MRAARSWHWLAVACFGAPARPLGITSVFDRELPNMVETFMSILHSRMVLKNFRVFSLKPN